MLNVQEDRILYFCFDAFFRVRFGIKIKKKHSCKPDRFLFDSSALLCTGVVIESRIYSPFIGFFLEEQRKIFFT
jgi:hypothetical protein